MLSFAVLSEHAKFFAWYGENWPFKAMVLAKLEAPPYVTWTPERRGSSAHLCTPPTGFQTAADSFEVDRLPGLTSGSLLSVTDGF